MDLAVGVVVEVDTGEEGDWEGDGRADSEGDIGLYQRCAIIREILIFTRNAGEQLTSFDTECIA